MIFGKESEIHVVHQNEHFSGINFTQLRSLSLQRLPQFTSFVFDLEKPVKESTITSASQEIIAEDDLTTLFNNKVIFPNVEKLELSNINIEKIWLDQLPAMSSSGQYLTKLTIEECHNLKYLFSPSMVNSLVELQELAIKGCKSIERVIDIRLLGTEEETIEIVFPKLVRLQLGTLPNLTTFDIGNSIKFPSLRELRIRYCNNLKRFISSSTPAEGMSLEENIHTDRQIAFFDEKVKLPSLEILRLDNMVLNKIWHHQLALDSFNKLRDLELQSCYCLKNIFPSNLCGRLERLEHLSVSGCDQLEEIIEKSSSNGIEVPIPSFVFPRLISLKLRHLHNLKNLYPGMHVSKFLVLEEVDISGCNKVEALASELLSQGEKQNEMAIQQHSFFLIEKAGLSTLKKLKIDQMAKLKIWQNMQVASESHTVGGLQNLEKLEVSDCELEDINELIETTPQLRILSLSDLWNLKQVWPMKDSGNRFQAFQNLISIEVNGLGSLKTLFPAEVARRLFQLESLQIIGLDGLEEIVAEEGVDQAVPSCRFVFPRLISLRLYNLLSLKSFYRGLHISDWPMLKELELCNCRAVKILASSEDFQHPLFLVDPKVAFPRLEELRLYRLSNLVHIWKENSHTCNVFQNLRTLRIDDCEMLENIIELQVGEEVKDDRVVFNQLESLDLYNLPRFRSFCLGNYKTLEFPYLKEVVIRECLNMQIFSDGVLHTPKLHKVQYTYEKEGRCWEDNLNSTIQKMFEEMVGYNGIDSLKLSEFPQAKEKWHSQALPISFFSNLSSLVVDNCTFMLSAIPANLLGFLNNLETLEVRNCDSVEEVFHLEEVNAVEHFGGLFPNLERLVLLDLPKLKRFCNFTKDIIELPNLFILLIENCPNMKTFISDSTQVDIIANKEPKEMTLESKEINISADIQPLFDEKVVSLYLKELKLSRLPKLLHLCKENSHPNNVFQNLEILEVSECHKLEKLVSSATSFKNLTTLKVSKCDGLINLMTLITAKSLVDLEEMKITDCRMIEEIIELQVEEEVKEDPIVFSQLKYLGLDGLPSLTHFYLGNYTLEFPDLEKVIVKKCSKMKIFSLGALRTPKLQRLHLVELEDEGRWEGDLNTTIQKLFKE